MQTSWPINIVIWRFRSERSRNQADCIWSCRFWYCYIVTGITLSYGIRIAIMTLNRKALFKPYKHNRAFDCMPTNGNFVEKSLVVWCREDLFNAVMNEREDIAKRRKACQKTLEALHSALATLNTLPQTLLASPESPKPNNASKWIFLSPFQPYSTWRSIYR